MRRVMPFRRRARHIPSGSRTSMTSDPPSLPWAQNPGHRAWLQREADALFAFFEPHSLDPAGGFAALDEAGKPIPGETARPLHATTRMAHCFAIGMLERPARRRRLRRSRHAGDLDEASRRQARRLFLVVRRRRPARARQARLRPRLRAARRLEREMRRPSRRAAPARRHFGNSGERDSGSPRPAPARRNSARTGRRSATIAARIPTCI